MDEQLERIKEDLTYLANSQNKIVTLGISDYEYVIQQADKAQELEEEVELTDNSLANAYMQYQKNMNE